MTDTAPKSDLFAALRKAATRELSATELHKQRVSFVMGSLKDKSNVTRDRVDEVLSKKAGYDRK